MNKVFAARICRSLVQRSMCTPANVPPPAAPAGSSGSMSPKYKPSELHKILLVWTKKYKTKEDIPKYVAPEIIDRARSEARIKISNILMLMTVLASVGAIISGKAAAKRGESVHQMNLDFHKQYREDYEKNNPAPESKA